MSEPVKCACVHHDAYECARIRDGIPQIEDIDPESEELKRECECVCHDRDEDDEP